MPSIGEIRDSGDVIDVVSINENDYGTNIGTGNGQAHGTDIVNGLKNGTDTMANGNLTQRLQEINDIYPKRLLLLRNLLGIWLDQEMKNR